MKIFQMEDQIEIISGQCRSSQERPFAQEQIDSLSSDTYQDISSKHCFSKKDLERCADGVLFGQGNAQLPMSPLLMMDRVIDIQSEGGKYSRGYAIAELDIKKSDWFFQSHFKGDPIMPGCLLIESLWQLTGFHLAWSGHFGKGRVLDSGRTKFLLPATQETNSLTITVNIKKILKRDNPIFIADGLVEENNNIICKSENLKIGLFS